MKGKSWLILAAIVVVTLGLGLLSAFGIGENKIMGVGNIRQGLDLQGGVSILFEANVENPTAEEMNSAVSLLQRRLDAKGWTEAEAGPQGSTQIRVDIPGVEDAEQTREEIGRTAQLLFTDESGNVILTGAEVANAQKGVITQEGTSQVVVNLEFNSTGTALFAEATRNNIGKVIYIIMDDQVISDPVVNVAITDGRCYIEGGFTAESAEYLATVIREGSLPFELNVISMNNVGARLGADALQTSILAGFIGIGLVLLFMLVMYRLSGLAADIALAAYTVLVLVLLSLFRITLTLPGIAGIILSVGMAVDANVVIFERIREEIRSGRTLRAAIEAGYKRAFPAIIDSNVTTLIAGLVLFWLGTGPVKGFAQTLSIGIVVSMFSSLIITRYLMTSLVGAGLDKPGMYAKIENTEEIKKTIPFVEHRKKYFIISSAIMAVGIAFLIINGARGQGILNLDVEFSGGTSFTIDIGHDFNNDDIAAIIQEVTGETAPQIQKITNSNQVMIKIRSLDAEKRVALIDAVAAKYSLERDAFTYSDVSPTVSADMQQAAVLALLVAMLCMLVYVTWRFRDIRMGASAILALLHDALVVIAAYAVLRIPINYSFIAVLLTIVGYSINATIIIFDRIRENRVLLRRESAADIVNTSVTQTLRRSIYTSVTTLLAILSLYILGVPSIKEFTLPLIIGLVVGAYSSVCLAGSFWHTMGKGKKA